MRQILNTIMRKQSAQLIQNRKYLLKRQSQQIQLLQPLKSKINNQLLDMNISELVKLDQQQVFNTFTCRILNPKVRQLNSLADLNIERALKKNPRGVPFTVKDHLKVDGMIQTCGFSKNIHPSTDCTEVVQLLQKQGCIAYGHTNVPQGLLGIQSSNRVYGSTRNPFNPKFVAGGSSGGQGPQIATKASVFALCSDSAGSVRIPAAFCGVYGFKPTGSKRLSVKGRVGVTGRQGPSIPGLDTSFGYLTRNVQDLEWLCQKTLGKSVNYKPSVYGKWNKQLFQQSKISKKRFGVISYNHEIQLAPAVKNVLNQTVQMLLKQGHEVIQFDFPQLYQFRNFFFQILNNVGFMNLMRQRVQGQHPMPQIQKMLNGFYSTYIGRKLRVHFAQSQLQKQKFRLYDIGNSSLQMMMLLKQRDNLQEQFNRKWQQCNIDLLLSPTMPFTAPYHGQTQNSIHQLTFTAFQNVLQLPAGHVPVRLVRQDQIQYEDKRLYGNEVRQAIQKSQGLPVGVQITGEFMKDEVVVGAMWQIQHFLGGKIKLPDME